MTKLNGVKQSLIGGAALLLGASIAQAADLSEIPSGKYMVDKTHAYVTFSYSHLGLSNPVLTFDEFDMDLDLNVEDPTQSSSSLNIVAESVVTGSEIWHDHITGEKWFDTSNHPAISFASTGVTANDDGTFAMSGDLTIKGVTKPVALDVVINGAMMHPMAKKPAIGIAATGKVLRSEWGMGANVPFVGDEVTINVTAELQAAN